MEEVPKCGVMEEVESGGVMEKVEQVEWFCFTQGFAHGNIILLNFVFWVGFGVCHNLGAPGLQSHDTFCQGYSSHQSYFFSRLDTFCEDL